MYRPSFCSGAMLCFSTKEQARRFKIYLSFSSTATLSCSATEIVMLILQCSDIPLLDAPHASIPNKAGVAEQDHATYRSFLLELI